MFRHLKLKLLTQIPASNDEKYINVVYICSINLCHFMVTFIDE